MMEHGKEEYRATGVCAPPPPYEFTVYSGYVPEICQQPSSAFLPPVAYMDKSDGAPPNYKDSYSPLAPPYAPTGPGINAVEPLPPGSFPVGGVPPDGYGMSNTAYPTPMYIYVQPTPLTDPPNDYMGYSLFVTLCCCWIIGLFAVARSAECRSAIRAGNRAEAELRSKQARKYSHIALWLGIVSVVVSVVIIGLYYGLVISRRYY